MSDFKLNIFSRLNKPKNLNLTLGSERVTWSRSAKVRGGPYAGTVTLDHESAQGVSFFNAFSLPSLYETALGKRIEENTGRYWHGIIYSMEYKHGGITEQISLDEVANRVATEYEDGAGDKVLTAYSQNDGSIKAFGTLERVLQTDGGADMAAAQVTSYLNVNGYPRSRPVDLHPEDQSESLTIEVAGPSYCLLWDYPDLGAQITLGNDRLDQLVSEIVNSNPFLTAGQIVQNTITLDEIAPHKNGLDYLNQICDLGGPTGAPWTFEIDSDYRLHYRPVSADYRFEVNGGRFVNRGSPFFDLGPRVIQPGVVRIHGLSGRYHPGYWLTDGRDVLIDEVRVDGNGRLKLGLPRGGYL